MRKLIFEVYDPKVNTELKLNTILKVLSKASGRDIKVKGDGQEHARERSPYRCLEDLSDKVYEDVSNKLNKLYSQIISKWIHSNLRKADADVFRLNGEVYLNPKTGKHLTIREFKAIQDDLSKIFGTLYSSAENAILKQAMAMGKILQSMEPENRLMATMASLNIPDSIKFITDDERFSHVVDYAKVHTGELIQDVTERSRKAIQRVIMQGYQDRISQQELETNLFNEFDVMNRDWRRIAETETATNFNNGYLVSELQNAEDGEHVFMQGISGGGACPFCRTMVDGKVVVMLDEPPATGGDTVDIDGETFTAIWAGKNNYGRKRADWWVSAGTQHPHCMCSWVRIGDLTNPFEKKMRAFMDEERKKKP